MNANHFLHSTISMNHLKLRFSIIVKISDGSSIFVRRIDLPSLLRLLFADTTSRILNCLLKALMILFFGFLLLLVYFCGNNV